MISRAMISNHIAHRLPYHVIMTNPRLLVIQHDLDDALNELAPPLVAAGLNLDTWCTWREEEPRWPLEEFSGVLSLGALASVRDEATVPWIAAETALLSRALDRGLPVLGVCFGAQALARAAGGQVLRSPVTEIGWFDVVMEPEASKDPVLGALGTTFPAFQSHYDTFELPPGTSVLGTTGDLIEAYRVGDSAWGVQFHIEANPSVVYGWLAVYRDAMDEAGVDIDELRASTRSNWADYRKRSWQVGAAFADCVVARHGSES
jgi:GMP synthase (glutamine-hydrolysing)